MDAFAAQMWDAAGGAVPDAAAPIGPAPVGPAPVGLTPADSPTVLASAFDVTGLAAATTGAAALAAAEFHAARTGTAPRPVRVDRRAACAAFLGEGLFTPLGWEGPPVWDPIAGNYRTATGWIRLHTNYAYHRAAAERVLGATDRASVAAAAARWDGTELESAVVAAGGCAAVLHTRDEWLATPAGAATADEPLLRIEPGERAPRQPARAGLTAPYAGIRVLDLTRVIAGPVATRFLAAYGADVLRIDPPGFNEVPALLPETTVGKRCTALDLRADRGVFTELVRTADVLVCGLRPGVLARLGYSAAWLYDSNPSLVVAELDAYGWDGPWQARRGFDSLVQLSCGIAATPSGGAEPVPLPCQALDHGTGYLLAAAIGRALTQRYHSGRATRIRASLIGTANVLLDRPVHAATVGVPGWSEHDTVPTETSWGRARRVPVPVTIDGLPAAYPVPAGPLGRHAPRWLG